MRWNTCVARSATSRPPVTPAANRRRTRRSTAADDIYAIAANRQLAECDRKLGRYRAALEAGTDPAVVAEWIKQIQAERAAAQTRAQLRSVDRPRMSREQIRYVVTTLTDLAAMIENADPRDKAEIYSGLGLRLTYHLDCSAVLAEGRPATVPVCVTYVSEDRD
jgi:site-specific DNA recombinase